MIAHRPSTTAAPPRHPTSECIACGLEGGCREESVGKAATSLNRSHRPPPIGYSPASSSRRRLPAPGAPQPGATISSAPERTRRCSSVIRRPSHATRRTPSGAEKYGLPRALHARRHHLSPPFAPARGPRALVSRRQFAAPQQGRNDPDPRAPSATGGTSIDASPFSAVRLHGDPVAEAAARRRPGGGLAFSPTLARRGRMVALHRSVRKGYGRRRATTDLDLDVGRVARMVLDLSARPARG